MVPLNVDFYKLKVELRKEILRRLEEIEIEAHPLDAGWLLYALSVEGDDDIFLKKV